MRRRLIPFMLSIWLLTPAYLGAQGLARRVLILSEAKELVVAALPPESINLKGFELQPYEDKDFPQYYFFLAEWAGSPGGSAVIGHYAVDKSTGDVWDTVVECDELTSPKLHKLQMDFREHLGLTDAEYHHLKTKGPLCE